MNKFSIAPARTLRKNNSFFNIFDDVFGKDMEHFIGRDDRNTLPSVNISSDEKGFTIDVAAPGYEKKDFNIEVDEQVLTLSGEKKVEEESKKYNRKEFNYSTFKRTFNLPEDVKADKITAMYKNGVLSVVIPKKEKAPKLTHKVKIG